MVRVQGGKFRFRARDAKSMTTVQRSKIQLSSSHVLQDRHVECVQSVAQKASTDPTSATTMSPDTPNVLQALIQIGRVPC